MKTISELLRDADPLSYEPARGVVERERDRQRVLNRTPVPDSPASLPRRTFVLAAAACLVAVLPAAIYWLQRGVPVAAAVRFEIRLAESSPGTGLRELMLPDGRRIYLHDAAVLTNGDILRAEVVAGNTPASFNIAVTFTSEGAAKIANATGNHIGRPLAILIDGDVVMAPVVRSAIADSAVITGSYTRAEAARIVDGVVGR